MRPEDFWKIMWEAGSSPQLNTTGSEEVNVIDSSRVMAVLTSALIFSVVWVVCSGSNGIQIMKAETGTDVILECRGNSSKIDLVFWNKADFGKHQYVFYRNRKTSSSKQLPCYRGRVSLLDPDMKDGNVSVVLKNVTISDNGTYECRTSENNTVEYQRKPMSRNKIRLTVTDGDSLGAGGLQKPNSDWMVWVWVGMAVLVLAVFGMVVVGKNKLGVVKHILKRPKCSNGGTADEEANLTGP
ncbi:uncharacterized protein V6R79_004641 [Siganus canaliculatus]